MYNQLINEQLILLYDEIALNGILKTTAIFVQRTNIEALKSPLDTRCKIHSYKASSFDT